MPKTVTSEVTQNIIRKVMNGQDYRIEIVNLINADFLQYVVDFFKKVVEAKLKNKDITIDWYKKEFLNEELPSDDLIINSGLNRKTVSNMHNSATREIVVKASKESYESLQGVIESLIDTEGKGFGVTLTLKLNKVSVELDVSESLIVINTIAVKRAALRGGAWSSAGKRVEKPLMLTLCKLFEVDESNYKIKEKKPKPTIGEFEREIDFYLSNEGKDNKCEVKLMGKGNPESADAVFARSSKVFIADKLSGTNTDQLDSAGILWVELRRKDGYMRFTEVLDALKIPYTKFDGDLNKELDKIFSAIFPTT